MRPMLRLALVPAFLALFASALAEPSSARELQFEGTAEVADSHDFRGLTFSPDGRHAYTLGDQAAVFAVDDSGTGLRLTFIENIELPDYVYSDQREIVVSADGGKVYITRLLNFVGIPTSIDDHFELLVYRRAAATGRLTLLESHRLDQRTFVLSPDGDHAYWVSEGAPVHALRAVDHGLDPVWQLTAAELSGGQVDGAIRNLQLSPDGKMLYALFEEGNSVGVWRLDADGADPEMIQLLRLEDILPDLAQLEDLVSTADGRLFLSRTMSHTPGEVGVLTLLVDEATGRLSVGRVYQLSSPDTEDPLWTVPAPADDFVVMLWDGMPLGGPSRLAVYERADVPGGLALVQIVDLEALPYSRDEPLFTPSGDALLLPSSSGLWSFSWNGSELASVPQEIEVADDFVGLNFIESIVTAPGSDRVYLSEFSAPAGVFHRTPAGGLELETVFDSRDLYLAISSNGEHLYGSSYDGLRAYELDPVTGLPAEIQHFTPEEGGPLGRLILSEDGRWLVVAGGDSVHLFSRDPNAGVLAPADRVDDGEMGFDFGSATQAVLSGDARHVYAAGFGNSVVVFDLDVLAGDLTPKQAVMDQLGDGFQYLSTLALSPDGRHLIVGGSNRLLIYEREAVTGMLTLAQTLPSGNVRELHALSEGRRVIAQVRDERLAQVSHDGLVELYWRDQASGDLTLVEVLDNREIGVHGLGHAGAFDPASSTLYVAGVQGRVAVVVVGGDGPCEPGIDRLCLADDRFEVRVDWRDFDGDTGIARVAPARSDDSGVLWFFSDKNWEMQVKVLDACAFNGRYWLFAASATTVETTMTVTDRLTGEERTYFNPLGRAAPAITDTDAFSGCGAAASSGDRKLATKSHPTRSMIQSNLKTTADRAYHQARVETGDKSVQDCGTSPTQACLVTRSVGPQRFVVEVEWRDGAGNHGFGRAAPARSDESALFWFFGPENWEVMVKILDGCGLNDSFWVLSAATTDVESTIRITDLVTDEVREYVNPLGTAASAVADIEAFGSCE